MVPDEITILACPAREGKSGPDVDLLLPANLLITIVRRVSDRCNLFQLITTHTVIENDIRVDPDAFLMEGVNSIYIFIFGTVLGTDSILLIKFTQIVHIVHTVAYTILGSAFISRRQPDISNAQLSQIRGFRCTALPPEAIIWKIPFKVLHHGFIG